MVRGKAFPFDNFSNATDGQLTWVYLNQIVDYDERVRKIHVHCLPKFEQERCEVCGEPIFDIGLLPPEIQKRVYVPRRDEAERPVEIEFQKEPDGFISEG